MSKIVFILGAGASADTGAPVMANFLDVAESLFSSQRVSDEIEHFELVFKGIDRLQRLYAKAWINTENIEAVFVAFETANLLGRLADFTTDELSQLQIAMRRVIVRTLEETIWYPWTGSEVLAPSCYEGFAKEIKGQYAKAPNSVSIITFNYDYVLDLALAKHSTRVNYCLGGAGKQGEVDVMKLHGSLSWSRNSSGQITPLDFYGLDVRRYAFSNESGQAKLNLSKHTCSPCNADKLDVGGGDQKDVCIVPPTWNKGRYYEWLSPVWRRAAQHLSEAEHIVVIGFSLPATDEFFRYLYALGSIGSARIKNFIVIDKYPSQELDLRYRNLLGPLSRNRYALGRGTLNGVAHWLSKGGIDVLANHVRSPNGDLYWHKDIGSLNS